MDLPNLLSITTLVLVIVCFLLAGFLLTVESKNALSNKLLASFLIVLAVTISVFFYGFYFSFPLVFEKLRNDIGMLTSPLMYLYVLASVYSGFKLRKIHLLHLLPFLIVLLVSVPRYLLVESGAWEQFISNFYSFPEGQITLLVSYLQPPIYIAVIYWTLAKARKILLENYSDARLILYKWLFQLNTVSLALFCFSIFKSLFRAQVTDENAVNLVRIILVFLLLCFLCWIVMKALYHPEIFRGIDSGIKPVADLVKEEKESETPRVDGKEKAKIETLLRFMEETKPFLDPSLTLQKLARQHGMAPNKLSILINHQIGKHFFDFVNEYRIKEAQAILVNADQKKKTVLEILYEVGFNSKSSFNTAFKKYTGTTPSQYRKSHS